jgi:hypothetical protein
MNALDPIKIDPRPCEWCDLTVDRHKMVDKGEGPEFFCEDISPGNMTLDELERRADLIRQEEIAAIVERWELADPRDRWRHTGEPRPRTVGASATTRGKPRVPQSTIDAFKYVVSLGDPDHLARWLRDHSDVSAALLKEVGSC